MTETEHTITIRVDQLDFDAIHHAASMRQAFRVMPEGGGDLLGRLIAEVCRGWIEYQENAKKGRWKP